MSTTTETVRDFIVDDLHFRGPREELTDDFPLLENRVIDSVGLLRMVEFLESRYHINIPDEELLPTNFETLAAITTLIESRNASRTTTD